MTEQLTRTEKKQQTTILVQRYRAAIDKVSKQTGWSMIDIAESLIREQHKKTFKGTYHQPALLRRAARIGK